MLYRRQRTPLGQRDKRKLYARLMKLRSKLFFAQL
jgi:hypothetical protein